MVGAGYQADDKVPGSYHFKKEVQGQRLGRVGPCLKSVTYLLRDLGQATFPL